MIFIGITKEFDLTNENQYNTIGEFWDELSLIYGLENLQGLGYKWKNNKIYYAIGLKEGIIKDSNFSIELPEVGWKKYKGKTYRVRIVAGGFELEDEFYKSLSAVAFHITGRKISGKEFFGV